MFIQTFFNFIHRNTDQFITPKNRIEKYSTFFKSLQEFPLQEDRLNQCARKEKKLTIIQSNPSKYKFSKADIASIERYKIALQLLQNKKREPYKTEENKRLYTFWKKYHNKNAFLYHPELISTILKNNIHHIYKYYGMPIQFDGATKHMLAVVNGDYINANALASLEKKNDDGFIDNKTNTAYAILPKKGLVKWKTTAPIKLQPCAVLSEKQVEYVQKIASSFVRDNPENKNRDYTLEIISSLVPTNSSSLTSGYADMFQEPKHPWIRLVTPNGDLYIAGYGWKEPVEANQIAETSLGTIRSPDPWETALHKQRPITRIPIDKEEFEKIKKAIEHCSTTPATFNLINHNCTKFVQFILGKVNIHVPLKITTWELLGRIFPLGVQAFFKKVATIVKPVIRIFKLISYMTLPPIVTIFIQKVFFVVKQLVERISVLLENTFLSVVGAARYKKIQAKTNSAKEWTQRFNKNNVVQRLQDSAMITTINDFLTKKVFKLVLPKLLIEWQLMQSSTRIFEATQGFWSQYNPLNEEDTALS